MSLMKPNSGPYFVRWLLRDSQTGQVFHGLLLKPENTEPTTKVNCSDWAALPGQR
ncbi:hypothetical protein KCP71_25955 [Salmonella enterica subsp. enterica]|nr:hypothetical protein KCP71_25955 [Salmonella enterica subsp. enterica]